jgi:magnesium transporter
VVKIIDIPDTGPARRVDANELTQPAPGTLRWIDIEGPTPEVLWPLKEAFGLHPLAIEDCLTFDQRPKIEEYPGHVFLVIHELSLVQDEIEGQEIHAFLGEHFLISVHSHCCRQIDGLAERVLGDGGLYDRGTSFIYYLMADAIASHNATTLDELAEHIDDVEDRVLAASSAGVLPVVLQLKRALGAARRTLSPQRDLFSTLARVEKRIVNERTAFYFRDVYDKLARAAETLETSRDLLTNVLDAHFSQVSQRTNEIMKHLTVLSAVFLPLTFVTGFFGQNFQGLPFASPILMWIALAVCFLLPPVMLFWFRRRKWL